MRFDPDFLDAIRARVPVSQIVGRSVALKKQGREYAALSPFNAEKTPSFFVNDDKQFYHCFSSGKHGDIFRWLMEIEGLSFPEAVERLAAEAGLALPEDDPGAARKRQKAKSLYEWMEAAARFFQQELRGPQGRDARAYLERRGLDPDVWATFELGYAPAGRTGLKHALLDAGASLQGLQDAGLIITPDDGGAAYDRFRDRVMFPIRDAQGRLIAFGGRALSKDARAKYLNSPETVLFDKGRTLYRYREARAALARDSAAVPKTQSAPRGPGGLLVAEGYMDVIALRRFGFGTAVAPLGTALTETQLELLWRAGPEPVLCFDGDAAGQRAAARAAMRALPLLKPGQSLRFAMMPAGQDPDDLLREAGVSAMAAVVADAAPLDRMVWDAALAESPVDTPERRAGLRQRLMDAAASIADEGVKGEFRRALLDRFYAAFRRKPAPDRRAGRVAGRDAPSAQPLPETDARKDRLAHAAQKRDVSRLLWALLSRPDIVADCAETLAQLETPDPGLAAVRDGLVNAAFCGVMVDKAILDEHVARSGGEKAAADLSADQTIIAAPIAPLALSAEEAVGAWTHAADELLSRIARGRERAEWLHDLKAARAAGDRARMTRLLALLKQADAGGRRPHGDTV